MGRHLLQMDTLDQRELSLTVQSHLLIHDVRHVPAIAEELHDLFAGACQLCPTGFRLWVLFQSTRMRRCDRIATTCCFRFVALSSESLASKVTRPCGDKLALTNHLPSRTAFTAGNSSLAASDLTTYPHASVLDGRRQRKAIGGTAKKRRRRSNQEAARNTMLYGPKGECINRCNSLSARHRILGIPSGLLLL